MEISTLSGSTKRDNRSDSHRLTKRRPRRWLEPYLLVLPTVVLIIGLMAVPILIVVGYSLLDNVIVNQSPQFVGLKNFVAILGNGDFWVAARNTLLFSVGTVAAHLVIGLAFAILLNTKLVGGVARSVFRVIYILPWIFTAAIVAVVWKLLLDPSGIINYILKTVGIIQQGIPWLSMPSTALFSVTVIMIWAGYPFFMISLLAGLQGIPHDLYEAARVDGANGIQQLISITLPQLRPVILSMALLDLLWTSQQFTIIWATTGGGPINYTEVLSTFTYKLAFNSYEFSAASASAVLVLVASLVIAIFYVRQQRIGR